MKTKPLFLNLSLSLSLSSYIKPPNPAIFKASVQVLIPETQV